ncbi:PDZ domain-containing protein [Haloferula rosea]|uniref:PDZ domain-containing protein n=1 Tax=Haloferula rosea TaxID=490093 RepID=A0A934VGZ4_9BACT|nr:PDZ domain-containing protein [Haloferula rosea]MBK1828556.1 PDZ domain-containing protein [Haloferula rosea]
MKSIARLVLGVFVGGIGLAGPVLGQVEPPVELVAGLSAESYPERVAAENALRQWAMEQGEAAWPWLLARSKGDPSPEVQERSLSVLKASVLRSLSDQRPGFVGITMAPTDVELGDEEGFGIQIRMVSPDSPAEKAGLLPQDVVTELNGEGWDGLDAADSFAARVGKMAPGTRITLGILRAGEKQEVELELGARPWSAGEYGEQRRMFMQRGGGLMFVPNDEETARDKAFQEWLDARDLEAADAVESAAD